MLYKASLLLVATALHGAAGAGAAYTLVGAGPCRGSGGSVDQVNHRGLSGVTTEAACEAHCDAIPADESDGVCAGFAWEVTGGNNECILYGPGMAGKCAEPIGNTAMAQADCLALGVCVGQGSGAVTEAACGICSDTGSTESTSCAAVGGTWTAGTWTTTGVWNIGAAEGAGWTGSFYHTDHIHAIVANANYVCYDKDVTDHHGSCASSTTTPSGTDCAAAFAAGATFEQDSCDETTASNCTWTAAPVAPTARPAHPSVSTITGYTFRAGACRGTSASAAADANIPDNADRPAYFYKKNTVFPNWPANMSPDNMATQCNAVNAAYSADPDPWCVGFHTGPWTSAFYGWGLLEDGSNHGLTGEGWSYDAGQAGTTSIDTSRPNPQYVCWYHTATKPMSGGGGGDDGGPVITLPALSLPCFPGDAAVTRESGAAARLDELKAGDKIRAADASGALSFDEVSRFSFADYGAKATFVTLSTAKTTLSLTAEHRVPIGDACCSTLKKAKDVTVGETVWLAAAGASEPTVVTKVGSAAGVGVHNPLMKHGGFPVVDGVVTAFESVGVVKFASLTIPLVEAACEATGTCHAVEQLWSLVDGKFGSRPIIGGKTAGGITGLILATGLAAGALVAGGQRCRASTKGAL